MKMKPEMFPRYSAEAVEFKGRKWVNFNVATRGYEPTLPRKLLIYKCAKKIGRTLFVDIEKLKKEEARGAAYVVIKLKKFKNIPAFNLYGRRYIIRGLVKKHVQWTYIPELREALVYFHGGAYYELEKLTELLKKINGESERDKAWIQSIIERYNI